jgi:hypothetical protein
MEFAKRILMIPPENLFISKNINIILFLLIYLKFMSINPVRITNFGVYVGIADSIFANIFKIYVNKSC